ncbi:MAG TPA: hypothetical protein VE076_00800, partial [Nitrososphaeraceae archaeon]|nr:hypothetical protein [Nitrososphaeraceae archaeon]
ADALKFGKELPRLKDQFQLLVEERLQTWRKPNENDAGNRKQHEDIWQNSEMGRVVCELLSTQYLVPRDLKRYRN